MSSWNERILAAMETLMPPLDGETAAGWNERVLNSMERLAALGTVCPSLWTGDAALGDVLTPPTARLPPYCEYNNLTVPVLPSRVTLTAPYTYDGPLIIRARGTIDIAGTITANGVGMQKPGVGSGSSGNSGICPSLGPVLYTVAVNVPASNVWGMTLPVPGGGGGYSNGVGAGAKSQYDNRASAVNVILSSAYKASGAGVYSLGGFAAGVAGGSSAAVPGYDGSVALTGAPALADLVRPELGLYALGCGGGSGAGGGSAAGGNGGGVILLIAPTVIIRSTGIVSANGGAGANGVSAGVGGGGGGGGGGTVAIICRHCIREAGSTVTASGGAGGNAYDAASSAGGRGADGVVKILEIL